MKRTILFIMIACLFIYPVYGSSRQAVCDEYTYQDDGDRYKNTGFNIKVSDNIDGEEDQDGIMYCEPADAYDCTLYNYNIVFYYHLDSVAESGYASICKYSSYTDPTSITYPVPCSTNIDYNVFWDSGDIGIGQSATVSGGYYYGPWWNGDFAISFKDGTSSDVEIEFDQDGADYHYSAIPTISGLPDQYLDESGSSNIDINLPNYASNDGFIMTYSITETNNGLVDCYVDGSDHLICNDPLDNQVGYSDVTVRVEDYYYAVHDGCDDNYDTDTLRIYVPVGNTTPIDNSYVNTDPFNITWNYTDIGGVDVNFSIYLSINSTYPPTFYDYASELNATYFEIPEYDLTYLQGYYYRVQGCYDGGDCYNSSIRHFTFNVSSLEPYNFNPLNNSVANIPVDLTWGTGRRTGAERDYIQVGNSSSTTGLSNISNIIDTSKTIPEDNLIQLDATDLDPDTQYWWRVKTEYDDGVNSSWEILTFNTSDQNVTSTLLLDYLWFYPLYSPTEKNVSPNGLSTNVAAYTIENIRGYDVNVSISINDTAQYITKDIMTFNRNDSYYGNISYEFESTTYNYGNASMRLYG